MDPGLLNLGSLILGLTAWGIAVANIAKAGKRSSHHRSARLFLSMTACAVALLLQIIYHYNLVMMQDIAAIYDTTATTAVASSILLIVTISLNTIAFVRGTAAKKLPASED